MKESAPNPTLQSLAVNQGLQTDLEQPARLGMLSAFLNERNDISKNSDIVLMPENFKKLKSAAMNKVLWEHSAAH